MNFIYKLILNRPTYMTRVATERIEMSQRPNAILKIYKENPSQL